MLRIQCLGLARRVALQARSVPVVARGLHGQCSRALSLRNRTNNHVFRVSAQLRAPSLHRMCVRSLFIQTQETPNPHAKKFFPGQTVMENGGTYVFKSQTDANVSHLARSLFHIEGVSSVMFGGDFITVNKKEEYSWDEVSPEIFAAIMDFFSSGAPVFRETVTGNTSTITDDDDDVVAMVKELLETRIKPVIHEDGGDIEFVKMENGVVYVKLHGACGTCPSSTATLKGGIENMLMHYVPEVEAVEQIFDESDLAGQEAFDKLEKDLLKKHLSH